MTLYELPAPLPLFILQSITDLQTLYAAACSCSLLRIIFLQHASVLFENAAKDVPLVLLEELRRLCRSRGVSTALARYHYIVSACTSILERKLDQIHALHYEHQLERTTEIKCGSKNYDPAGYTYRLKRLPLFWDEQQGMVLKVLRGQELGKVDTIEHWSLRPFPRIELASDLEKAWRHTYEETNIDGGGRPLNQAFSRYESPLHGADYAVLDIPWNDRRLAAMGLAWSTDAVQRLREKRGDDDFYWLYEEWYNWHWFYHSVLKMKEIDGPCGKNCTYHLGVPHICVHRPEEDYIEDDLA